MTKERMIEILAEEYIKKPELSELYTFDELIAKLKSDTEYYELDQILTAMQRVGEEYEADMSELERQRNEDALSALGELNHLRAELERLKQCEAIVRELAETGLTTHYMGHITKARKWVKEKERHTPGDDGGGNTNKL